MGCKSLLIAENVVVDRLKALYPGAEVELALGGEIELPYIKLRLETGASLLFDTKGYCTGGKLAALVYAMFAPGDGFPHTRPAWRGRKTLRPRRRRGTGIVGWGFHRRFIRESSHAMIASVFSRISLASA